MRGLYLAVRLKLQRLALLIGSKTGRCRYLRVMVRFAAQVCN